MARHEVTNEHMQTALRTLGYNAALIAGAWLAGMPTFVVAAASVAVTGEALRRGRAHAWSALPPEEQHRRAWIDSIRRQLQAQHLPVTDENVKVLAATLRESYRGQKATNIAEICAALEAVIENPRER